MIRPVFAALALLALTACDPAGPANVRLIPIGNAGDGPDAAPTGDGAPLDAMRADVSPVGTSTATADPAALSPEAEEGSATELAAAATAAVAAPSASAATTTDNATLANFANATTHPVGTAVHTREFASTDRATLACARYTGPDQAQSAFLAAGGPSQDPRGMDPDGDGYVCGWDPAAYRSAGAG